MPELTFEHLPEILMQNKEIHSDVHLTLNHYLQTFHPKGWNFIDGAKKFIEQQHYLIEAPIEDSTLGGFIRTTQTKKFICYINSAQPRMYQNFIVFHELYHLITQLGTLEKMHFVEAGLDTNNKERKADYFASLLLLDEHKLRAFFLSQENEVENLLTKVILSMYVFKAPYKATLIRLYELGLLEIDELYELFDKKIDFTDTFKKLGLDTYILEPSYVINFKILESLFEKNALPPMAQSSNQNVFKEIQLFFANSRKEK